MKFLLIVIFINGGGLSTEFNNQEACNSAMRYIGNTETVKHYWCLPKGKTDLNKFNDSLEKQARRLLDGN